MSARVTGRYHKAMAMGVAVDAFVPFDLPPLAPVVAIEGLVLELLQNATESLRQLEVAIDMLPSLNWFLYAAVRKEAVLTSQIEGTQASLVDLLDFEAQQDGEATATPNADVEEVCNYIDALNYAHGELASPKGLPLSMRLLCEAHRLLLNGARGSQKMPGEVRRSQVWIGGSRPDTATFVPAPAHLLAGPLSTLEKYMHDDSPLPALVRIGLLHVQFETLHPFLDGNGRIGRLLIALLLEHWGLLSQPALYVSLFCKQNRAEYYRMLNGVRVDGDWESWLAFFLTGVAQTASESVQLVRTLFLMVAEDRAKLLDNDSATFVAMRAFEMLPKHPIVTAASLRSLLKASKPTVSKALEVLVDGGVLVETSGRRRDRSYAYRRYLDVLKIGTDLA